MGGSLLAVGVLAAACGSSSSSSTTTTTRAPSSSSSSSSATVRTGSVPGLGTVLVNSAGRTLYLFTTDKQSTPTCAGGCAVAWPALTTTGTPTAGPGVRASLLGTVQGADGTTQVTYNHWPLYTFAGDAAVGEARGQGNLTDGGDWWVLDTAGSAVTHSASTSSSASVSGAKGSGGDGY